jgi:dTDP-4-amino-4,6-dideoxygalactose transaminase
VFTDNDELAAIIRSLCVHGKGKDKYDNVHIGMNSRLDTIQAAILLVKLEKFIDTELEQVNDVADWYGEELNDSSVICPKILDGFYSSWAQYTIVCKDSEQRETIRQRLKEDDVPSMIYYAKGLHEQKAFEGKCKMVGDYENTSWLTQRVLSLPMHPYLKKDKIRIIAGEINNN